jgi:SNF2 family DNA or RNA helicase
MLTLKHYKVTKNVPFQLYLLSDQTVKKTLLEFQFYNVRFFRAERVKDFEVYLEYPAGNLYWYVDFKKAIESQILSKENLYATEWQALLSGLKAKIKAEFESMSQRIRLITPKEVVEKMHKYNLRDYQAFDLIQLGIKMEQSPIRTGLILSEQRTGKTRVAVATVLEHIADGAVTVICPKSAIAGWVDEFRQMNKHLDKEVFHIKVLKHLRDIKAKDLADESFDYNVRIVTYELFKMCTVSQLKAAMYSSVSKNLFLLIDEAHRLRNFKTQQSETIFRFKAQCIKDSVKLHIVGLTGTPAVKTSADVFGVFSLINVSKINFHPYYTSFNQFKEYFYNCEDTSYGKVCKTLKRTHEFEFLIQTSSVQTKQRDLTMFENYTKKYIKVDLNMTDQQREIYDSVEETMEYGDEIDCMNSLVQLTRLQQICIDPSSLVSSFATLAPKIDWIREYAKSKTLKTIIMAKKLTALKAVQAQFDKDGTRYTLLKGAMSISDRIDAVNEFRQNPEVQFILLQLDVGKEALTLPEAKCTIFLDRDFAQGFNEQAEARMTPVDGLACTKYVIDLVMRNTVEEAIYDILVIRKESIDTVNTVNKICKKGGT